MSHATLLKGATTHKSHSSCTHIRGNIAQLILSHIDRVEECDRQKTLQQTDRDIQETWDQLTGTHYLS